MTKKTITSLADLKNKIEENRYDYFTLPTLDIHIKYRRPDLLKLSYSQALPAAIASQVIDAYKKAVGGENMEEFVEDAKKKLNIDDTLIKELPQKGYELLKDLATSHKFLDVPESDLDAEPVPLISWKDVPEEDAIAFLFRLLEKEQKAENTSGGEVTFDDVTEFPDRKRSTNRRTTRKNG